MPCEREGGDQGDASTGQGTPKIAGRPPEAGGEAWVEQGLPDSSEGTNSANAWTSDS